MKNKKTSVMRSVLALLLCFAMLVGTTFAWFTDGVSSGTNTIAAGSLDIELDYLAPDGTWKSVDAGTEVLDKDALWEPGYTEVAYLRITNAGTLALKYAFGIGILNETGSINAAGDAFKLSDYIEFGVVESTSEITYADRTAARNALSETKLISEGYSSEYSMKTKGDVRYVALVVYMPESVGNAANYATGKTPPEIELGIELVATQEVHESDSFGTDYDTGAVMPGFSFPENLFGDKVSANVTADENNQVATEITIQGTASNAVIPAGVQLEDGATELTLAITSMSQSDANITLGENDAVRSLDVHVQGVSADNTTPMEITIKEAAAKGLNAGNLKLYHVENGVTVAMTPVDEFTAHNQFKYDPATGDITLYMATFSEVALVADTVNAWGGTYDYDWYTDKSSPYTIANADQLAAFGKIVGGMADGIDQDSFTGETVNLISDINLGDKDNANDSLIFHPIGYYYIGGDSSVNSFEGTFDGTGHTIANFYQNTWEIIGDYDGTYYKDAMGLFGYVYNGTVKNLTVSNFSSDGEFTPTGVIAAYAAGNANFTNIAITNCNPRVYNTGNGGIIGIAGSSSGGDSITLQNITVDNSNKISALWGSWDVACGGLVGMFRGNDKGSTISFTNCHVAAQIDVYNDVCANYQYYAYRYAGMIIGSVRNNTTTEDGKSIPNMTGISASGCTVNYGDWNDYYYCEFEANTMASYSEDYQFSRVDKSEIVFDENGNVTGCTHEHTEAEDKRAVYLPFHQLFTGYGWGVNSVGLEAYSGIVIEGLDITEGEQEESVVKFETKFTGEFLYRVGNLNNVTIGDLFAAVSDEEGFINDAGVYVTIDKVDENSNVSGTFTANTSDWTKGTIQFSGTGVVKLTIQDYDYCESTVLYLEVVDAKNATTATSATANNVVLLNDCGFGSVEVSGGYTLFGNGFTMTCSSDSYASDLGYAFVTLNNGTLDNVQIVCPNFDYAALYKSNLTSTDNRSYTTEAGKTYYYNARSGVMASGNSQILNSRISGARAAVNVSGGNVLIDNSRIELGAVASILVGSANSLTLRDVTLVQKPTASTYDSSKTLMGFSVLLVCDDSGNAAPVTLEGKLVQNAWVDESDSKYVPSAGQSIISGVLSNEEYAHDLDGDGTKESLNLGFAYMPASVGGAVNTTTITDNRTNKDEIPYDYATVSIGNGNTYVYSYKYDTSENIPEDIVETPNFAPTVQGATITVSYSDTTEGITTNNSYGTDGWVYEVNVDLDVASGYALDFSKLSMTVNGVAVTDYKVNGSDKPTEPITVTAGGTTYTLTATVNGSEYSALFKVTGTETSKESPSLVASNYEAALLVGEAGSKYGNKDTWHGAAPVLNGIQIKYWSVAEKQYKTITLSDYTPTTAGKQNGTNAEWTYSPDNGDFTLTIKNETAVHSSNSVYAMPVVCNSKLYFVASSSNGLVNYGNSARTVIINYYFKDNNGGDELKFSYTWSIECDDGNTCYDYSDFCSGTSNKFTISSSNGCFAEGTLITLADGTQKPIEQITYADELLAWDFNTGAYAVTTASLIESHEADVYRIINLKFADGTVARVVVDHGFFDVAENNFVYIDEENVDSYIGHDFVKVGENGTYESVELIGYEVSVENVSYYTIQTAIYNNCIAENMFSLTSPSNMIENDGWFDYFEVGEGMKYDEEQKQADIEKYGLYTYEDFAEYVTYEQFIAFNGPYLKVLVGKGVVTYEQILDLIATYVNN